MSVDTYTIRVGNKVIEVNKATGSHVPIEELPLMSLEITRQKDGWHVGASLPQAAPGSPRSDFAVGGR